MEKVCNHNTNENPLIEITVTDYSGKRNILHINGIPMWNDNVYVTNSKVKGVEWGLFANRVLAKGNIILQYKGDILRENDFTNIIKNRGYAVIFSRQTLLDQLRDGYKSPIYAIDAYPYVEGKIKSLERIGGFSVNLPVKANTSIRELDPSEFTMNDIEYYRLFMYADQNISRDEEILWNYDFVHRGDHNEIPRSD